MKSDPATRRASVSNLFDNVFGAMPVMIRLMLISAFVAGAGAQISPFPRTLDVWRGVRAGLLDKGNEYFNTIKGAEVPDARRMFDGTVVSKPSPNKLAVNVDDPAGDAILVFDHLPQSIQPGSRVHFKGVIDSYTRRPYSLTLIGARLGMQQATAPSRNGGAVAQPASATRPDEFFVHPEVLCKALEQYGIHTGTWAPIGKWSPAKNPFECEYSSVPDGEPRTGHPHSTVFRVSGDFAQRADIISLAVNVGNPSEWPQAQEEFLRLASGLFVAIGQPEPAALTRAINARRYYLRRMPYGVLWFNFIEPMEPSPRRTFWLRLSQGSVPTNR